MNIFILDKDIDKCAEYHCDKHVVKMILETAQLLCTVMHIKFEENCLDVSSIPYKKTHPNHPSTVWVRESYKNFQWTLKLGFSLCRQYEFRYQPDTCKEHKTKNVLRWVAGNVGTLKSLLPDIGLTDFAQAMPDIYRSEDAVKSYRNYYMGDKHSIARWEKSTPKPNWYTPNTEKQTEATQHL